MISGLLPAGSSRAFCVGILSFNFTLSGAVCEEASIRSLPPNSPTSVIGSSWPLYMEGTSAPQDEKPPALLPMIDENGADEVKEYLWSVYQRSSAKRDSHGDFTWKDAYAAARLGLSVKDFVIGGMDVDFAEQLFAVGHAMDAAGIEWTILSAFRDDYRQSLATGFRAQVGTSFHGGSIATGGYGRGCAVDVASADGVSNDTIWTWIDLHGRQFGLERPMARIDPAHVQPRAGWHDLAATLRNQRVGIPAVRATNPASDLGAIYPSSTREPSTASLLEGQFTCVGSRLAGEFNKGRGLVHRLNSLVAHRSASTATKNSRNAKWTAAIHGGNPVRSPDGDSQHAHRRGGATLRVEAHVPPRLPDRTAQTRRLAKTETSPPRSASQRPKRRA